MSDDLDHYLVLRALRGADAAPDDGPEDYEPAGEIALPPSPTPAQVVAAVVAAGLAPGLAVNDLEAEADAGEIYSTWPSWYVVDRASGATLLLVEGA